MTTNLRGGLTVDGVPVMGNGIWTGKTYFVKPYSGNDENTGTEVDFSFKTLAKAKQVAEADKNDRVFLISESNTASLTTDYQSSALDWNKDGVSLVGVSSGSFIGQRARISNLSTATAIVDGLFRVTADNCMIANIGLFQGQGGTNPTGASIAMTVSGERNLITGCQISGIGHSELDDATSRSLKVSGGENTFDNCYIGLDTTIRATATTEVEVSAGARNTFNDCLINSYTSLSTFKGLTCGTPDRFVWLKDTTINAVQGITSAVAPTGAIASGSINGQVILTGSSAVVGYANVTTADDTKVYVSAPAGGLVDMGLATTVDIA